MIQAFAQRVRKAQKSKLHLTIYLRCTTLPAYKEGKGFLHEYTYFGASSCVGGLVTFNAVLDGGDTASSYVQDRDGPQ